MNSNQYLDNYRGKRCVLTISTAVNTTKKGDDGFIEPITIGTTADTHGYFFRVQHYVDCPKAVIEELGQSLKQQVWTTEMCFEVKLQYGYDDGSTANSVIPVDTLQTWFIRIPARNPKPITSKEMPISDFLPTVLNINVEENHTESSLPSLDFESHLNNYMDKNNTDTLRKLKDSNRLYFTTFSILGRMIAPSNTFKTACETKELQHIIDWLEHLHSRTIRNTQLSFQLLYHIPIEDRFSVVDMNSSLNDFKKAMILESNSQHDHALRYYGVSSTTALKSCQEGAFKDPEILPNFELELPLVWHNTNIMYLSRSLDMYLLYYHEHAAYRKIKETIFRIYTLILKEGRNGTFGALVELPPACPSTAKLKPGTTGTIEWVDRKDMGSWTFVVGQMPKIGRAGDLYVTLRPEMQQDKNGSLYVPEQRPRFMIDLEKAVRANNLKQRLGGREHERVRLHVKQVSATERQQYKALQIANPSTLAPETLLSFSDRSRCTPEVARKISDEVTALLSGQSLKEVKTASFFSKDFVKDIKNKIESVNKSFAQAIKAPGATLSSKQLEFALEYPANAPADGKLLCNGYAGSSKSTCLGVYMSLQHMDAVDLINGSEKQKRGLLLAKMHKTIDASIASIAPIVWEFTGRYSVREYTDMVDLEILKWILNNCSEQYSIPCDGLDASEYAEVNDLIRQLKASIKLNAGHQGDRFIGYQNTAVWIVSMELGAIKQDNTGPRFKQTFPSSGVTTEEMTVPLPEPEDEDNLAQDIHTSAISLHPERKVTGRRADFEFRRANNIVSRPVTLPMAKNLLTRESPAKSGHSMHLPEQGSWQRDYYSLLSLLTDMLQRGTKKTSKAKFYGEDDEDDEDDDPEAAALILLRDFKKKWYAEKVAVVGTTISNADSQEVMDWDPTHLAGDEWQSVADPDCLIVMTAHSGIPMYFVGDTYQPSPYVDDAHHNMFHVIRERSWFEVEIERGRDHITLNESRRSDAAGVRMVSKLIYHNDLKSVAKRHPECTKIQKLFHKHFKTQYRHLFLDTNYGTEETVGTGRSVYNHGVVQHVLKLVQLLVEGGFELENIGIITPYSAEEQKYRQAFTELPSANLKAPKIATDIGSILAWMGAEAKIVIMSIAKTEGLGFLNKKGYWCVCLSRSQLSTIIVANDTSLQRAKQDSSFRYRRQFAFYDRIIAFLKERKGYARWPQSIKTSGATAALASSLDKFYQMQKEVENISESVEARQRK